MPLDPEHLHNPAVALDALLKAGDLQQHLFELNGRLARLNALHGLRAELEPEVLTRKVRALGDVILADFRAIQTMVTHLEKILSGQDPFPVVARRRRRAVPHTPLSTHREED